MKITMDKKWAQRQDPTKEVRVLCVDSVDKDYPVVYLDDHGTPRSTTSEGQYFVNDGESRSDLVPLQEKVADVWVVVRNDGTLVHQNFPTESKANSWIRKWGEARNEPYRVVRMTQAEEKS